MSYTSVVIHGSVLTSPAGARDVDAIFFGDPHDAERLARGWAADHGHGHLPLDLHESRYKTVRVPTPQGEERPWLRIAGSAAVELLPIRGLAAAMRRASFDLAAFDAAFLSGPGRGCRFGLTPDKHASGEWDAYVEGPDALRSALRHVPDAAWEDVRRERPERAAFIEALAEFGASRLSLDMLDSIGGQGGGAPQRHIYVAESGECSPLYSRAVGPWTLASFTEALRTGDFEPMVRL